MEFRYYRLLINLLTFLTHLSLIFCRPKDDFINQIPISENTELIKPEIPERPQLDLNEDEPDDENNDIENFTIVHIEKEEDEILSISGIVAISCAVAAAIALFFFYEARRRNRARINRMSRFSNEKKGFIEDGVIGIPTSSTSIEEIKVAINKADWDGVYKLASLIAENDDGLSIPSLDMFKGEDRSHLDAEDQERAKTLDDLAANGDWTGLAVTAALYAGETSGSSPNQSNGTFAFGSNNPSFHSNAVNKDVEDGHNSMEKMVSNLSRALNAGDWSQVTKYANLIKNEKNSGNSFDADSHVILSDNDPSIVSRDTSKTEMSKKQTIAKLMRAGKWKGVSIMANMYEMESKQRLPSSPMKPYPPSPNHPYSDTRSIIRTKELRHQDRVQENIVSFRRDP